MTRTITGLFDSRTEADAVIQHLRAHDGIDPSRLNLHHDESRTTVDAPVPSGGTGFWASLRDLFVSHEDRHVYSEGIRRGGFVVSAEVPDDLADHAMEVFERHGAVDLDMRASEWNAGGWKIVGDDAIVGGTPTEARRALPDPEEDIRVGRRDTTTGFGRARSYYGE